MITVAIVDDHHALRAGLETVLGEAAGLVAVGSASGEHDLWPLLHRTRPDVVLMDYHLPGTDGLVLCRRIKRSPPPVPRVLIYSAYAAEELALPAFLAGADGLIHKGAPAHEVFEAINTFVRGEPAFPQLSASVAGGGRWEAGPGRPADRADDARRRPPARDRRHARYLGRAAGAADREGHHGTARRRAGQPKRGVTRAQGR